MADRTTQGGAGGEGDRDGIRTFPSPVDLSLSGVGMQVGAMGTGRVSSTWTPRWTACTASTSTS